MYCSSTGAGRSGSTSKMADFAISIVITVSGFVSESLLMASYIQTKRIERGRLESWKRALTHRYKNKEG